MKYARYIVFFAIIFILFSSLIKNIFDYRNKLEFYNSYKLDYEKEKKNNSILKTEIRKKNSKTEIEKTIRNQLNLLKENEIMIMIPTPTPTPVIITPTPAPNWKQWVDLFIK